jgi:spermidine synthase
VGVRAASVGAVAAALLSSELLWLRWFAVQHYHHFAYLAVGTALLGIGASGTALALVRDRVRGRERAWYVRACLALPFALLAAPVAVGRLPFEPTQIVWDRGQVWVLGLVVLVLALPFVVGGAALVLALQGEPARAPVLYGANLLGSAVGAAVSVAALVVWPPETAPAVAAGCALVAAALALDRRADPAARGWLAALAAVGAVALVRPPWRLEMTPFKPLPQARAYPGAVELAVAWDPTAWVVAVEAPALRYAPGLSLAYRGGLPPQVGLFADGEWAGAVTRWAGDTSALEFARWLPSAAPYAWGRPSRVLVLAAGGGLEVLSALAHGARFVEAVDLSPSVVRVADRVAGPGSSPYARSEVRVVVADARAALRRGGERFDVIQIGPAGSLASAAAGVYAGDADYLNTVEGYADAVRRLAPGGVLAVTRWIRWPARDNLRVIATAAAALRALGFDDVGPRLAVLRSWSNVVVLVKPEGFAATEAATLRAFALARGFDVDWLAGPPPPAPALHRLDRNPYAEIAAAVAAGPEAARAFFASYPFDVRPATDARPFFGRFLSLRQAIDWLDEPAAEWAPYAEWGTLVLVAGLALSGGAATLFLLLPALLAGRRRAIVLPPPRFGRGLAALYFGGSGLGYLLVEMAVMQRLQLWLGHPVYAAAATLAAFLACSGLGSLWVQDRRPLRAWWAAAAVAALVPVYAWILSRPGDLWWAVPWATRAALALLLLFPLATAMGTPFPLGLDRAEAPGGPGTAWAWAANGFASVVAAPLAVAIALEAGFVATLLAGAAAYAVAAAALAWAERGASAAVP